MRSLEAKLHVLINIERRKDTLFGNFSDKLTKADKAKAWQEVFNIGREVDAFQHKTWKHVRDVFWPNMRRLTMAKLTRVDPVEGKVAKLNELHKKVLEILGNDSPGECAFKFPVKYEEVLESAFTSELHVLQASDEVVEPQEIGSPSSTSIPLQPVKKRKISTSNDEDELVKLKKQKMELEVDQLKLQNRKLSLEIIQLENSLGLRSSAARN